MPDLKDTFVVHCSMCTCTMGMRPTYIVLEETHGVFLKGQAQMTVKDCIGDKNIICFGGCYSMENPDTQKVAEEIDKKVEEECPDTWLDGVINFFSGGKKQEKKQNDPALIEEGIPIIVGECTPVIVIGQEWDNGKDGVETDGERPLLGEAKVYCMYGGEIKIDNAGQPEAGE